MMNNLKLEQIKENIRTINPNFTDELLDLLYEYICTRQISGLYNSLKDDKVQKVMKEITLSSLITK